MTVEEVIKGRRSIRKFKKDEISRDLLEDILETASWAPSWGNTQPWEFYILTGKPLDEFREKNHEKMVNGEPFSTDVPMQEDWPEHMKRRYGEMGKIVMTSMGIKRRDKDARNKIYQNMATLFDAPCLIVACMSRDIRIEYGMFDIGLIMQTICLSAYEKGIGSCIMAVAIGYPELLREILSIPEDRSIIIGAALGYPDKDSPINNFERERAPLTEFVKWVG
ncbi:MAG: nitroreductase [Syntrophales bacterium]|nr:nitroreductase [Syntrophales bacterium]